MSTEGDGINIERRKVENAEKRVAAAEAQLRNALSELQLAHKALEEDEGIAEKVFHARATQIADRFNSINKILGLAGFTGTMFPPLLGAMASLHLQALDQEPQDLLGWGFDNRAEAALSSGLAIGATAATLYGLARLYILLCAKSRSRTAIRITKK